MEIEKVFVCTTCGKKYTPSQELLRLKEHKEDCACDDPLYVPNCWFSCADGKECVYYADCLNISNVAQF